MRFIAPLARLSLILCFAATSIAEESKVSNSTDSSLKALQGRWRLVSIEQNEQTTDVADDADAVFVVRGNDIFLNDNKVASFQLLQGASDPKLIDVAVEGQGTIEGVYEVSSKCWRICVNSAAQGVSKERPTALTTRSSPSYQLLSFSREPE